MPIKIQVCLVFLLIFLPLNSSGEPTPQLADQVSKEWNAIYLLSNNSPDESLAKAIAALKKAQTKGDVLEELHGRLIVIKIHLSMGKVGDANSLIDEALPLANATPFKLYQGLFLAERAAAYILMQKLDDALAAIDQAMLLFVEEDAKLEISTAHTIRAQVLLSRDNHSLALKDLFEARDILLEIGNKTNMVEVLSTIAIIYDKTDLPEKAIEYYKESMTYLDRETQILNVSIIQYNIGFAYKTLKNWPESKRYLQAALAASEKLNDDAGKAYVWTQLADIDVEEEKFELAIIKLEKALAIFDQYQDVRMLVNVRVGLAKAHMKNNQLDIALESVKPVLDIIDTLDNLELKIELYNTVSEIYEKQNVIEKSFRTYKEYVKYLKLKNKNDQEKTLNELQVKFDTEGKEAKNKILEQENLIHQTRISQQDLQTKYYIALAGLSLLVIIGVIYGLFKQIKMKQRFASLAMTDELTGAPNRRHILEYAKTQFNVAQETTGLLAIGVIDLDYFKKINDGFGHDVGDAVLRAFYQATQSSIRSVDRIGRVGGEEWLLVMPGASSRQISFVFQRIKENLNQIEIPGLDKDREITFSMGVAEMSTSEKNIENYFKRADNAVYMAKENGRDQWISA